jgi:hypothetical protein
VNAQVMRWRPLRGCPDVVPVLGGRGESGESAARGESVVSAGQVPVYGVDAGSQTLSPSVLLAEQGRRISGPAGAGTTAPAAISDVAVAGRGDGA